MRLFFFLKSDFEGVGGLFVPGLSVKRLSGLLKFAPRKPRRRKIDKNLQNGFYRQFFDILHNFEKYSLYESLQDKKRKIFELFLTVLKVSFAQLPNTVF